MTGFFRGEGFNACAGGRAGDR